MAIGNPMENKLLQIQIKGLSCSACALKVQKKLDANSDIEKANVNFANRTAYVQFKNKKNDQNISKLQKEIESIGYGISEILDPEEEYRKSNLELKKQLWISLFCIFTGVLMMGFMGFSFSSHKTYQYFQALLTLIIIFTVGPEYLKALVLFVKNRTSNMNTLVGLGVVSSFLLSGYYLFFPFPATGHPPIYFETAVFIIGFIKFGKYLEEKARQATSQALQNLISYQSKVAFVFKNGKFQETPTAEIQLGDRVLIKTSERAAVDGVVLSGNSSMNEALLTGEARPIYKTVGSKVISGSLNLEGSVEIQATKIGADTSLSQILSTLQEAQGSKPQIQRLADRVSEIFVPWVLVISLVTLLTWYLVGGALLLPLGLLSAISVLVIACPCALGLATPTAIMVGTGLAAARGIFFRNGEALEKLAKIDSVIFDKTGTLTQGQPQISKIFKSKISPSKEPKQATQNLNLESIYLSLLQKSTHPLSQTIYNQWSKELQTSEINFEIKDFFNDAGQGLRAVIQNPKGVDIEFRIGQLDYCLGPNQNEILPLEIQNFLKENESKSIVTMSSHFQIDFIFSLEDFLKPETPQILKRLSEKGLQIYVLSGDREEVLKSTLKNLPITAWKAQVTPSKKLDFIKDLQLKGQRVLMLGDGVNDAPALAVADVGAAMSTGSDVAITSSDLTLLNGNLNLISQAFLISQKTILTIQQNLFLSFIYNSLAIPVAAGILYPWTGHLLNPMWASLAMALSSVSVVANSLILKKRASLHQDS